MSSSEDEEAGSSDDEDSVVARAEATLAAANKKKNKRAADTSLTVDSSSSEEEQQDEADAAPGLEGAADDASITSNPDSSQLIILPTAKCREQTQEEPTQSPGTSWSPALDQFLPTQPYVPSSFPHAYYHPSQAATFSPTQQFSQQQASVPGIPPILADMNLTPSPEQYQQWLYSSQQAQANAVAQAASIAVKETAKGRKKPKKKSKKTSASTKKTPAAAAAAKKPPAVKKKKVATPLPAKLAAFTFEFKHPLPN